MILAAHQPDLFPYPGFWVKMAQADLFDLAIHDQFQRRGYQSRVKMHGSWVRLATVKADLAAPIRDIRLTQGAAYSLRQDVTRTYMQAPFWADRGPRILDLIERSRADMLWQFNVALIVGVKEILGIRTPVSIAEPPAGRGTDGLIDVCRQYAGVSKYLSGAGGRAYMGDDPEGQFAAEGYGLRWMNYASPTEDSILTLLFNEENPVETMMSGVL